MTIKFIIYGNQENQTGNPVPYVRSTRRALWRKDGKRYAEWKRHVRSSFAAACASSEKCMQWLPSNAKYYLIDPDAKVLDPREFWQARMDIVIHWRNRAHGDPDNIWKGIADALFVNDKDVNGSFESHIAEDDKGKVEVTISISTPSNGSNN